jgi:signal transduction histidine kinase
MDKISLGFSTNAKLEKLIGRELITNNVIAIFELIKNSYDAFAHTATITFENFNIDSSALQNLRKKETVISNDKSKIIIKDDGYGMTFEEVKTKWMEIGTTSKENTYLLTSSASSKEQRVINGEKGIGRFGADKLGSFLKMISVGKDGFEKTILEIDWNKFDDHEKNIQDIEFDCYLEHFETPQATGVTLEISSLRDRWTVSDVVKLKNHLKKLISPFAQEQERFQIYLEYGENDSERIVNDSFDYATTGIEAKINQQGFMEYTIYTTLDSVNEKIKLQSPSFGPVKLQVLYMDRAAKTAFTKRNGATTKDYGNIKVFRDDFRVLPYGEKENDWLGIDNKHAQGAFRTFGTRDLIGYVQISKIDNPKLKDATSRQGLNEDIDEFEDFKAFIWRCIELLQAYVFNQIKLDSEKQGEVIKDKVKEIKKDLIVFKNEIPSLYDNISISDADKKILLDRTTETFENIHQNIESVEQANRQLSNRVKVMEKIVGAENRLYDLLHAIKNRLTAMEALITEVDAQAKKINVDFDKGFAERILKDINKMILSAMRRSSPRRNKRDTIILSYFIEEFIDDNRKIYNDIEFEYQVDNYYRIFVNVEGLRISLENLLDNAVKAMQQEKNKKILIYITGQSKGIHLFFEDNGTGVPESLAPFIFNVSFTTTNGSGIGLPNVLDFMRAEGGDINLLEHGKLKGAAFEMIFPIKGGVM